MTGHHKTRDSEQHNDHGKHHIPGQDAWVEQPDDQPAKGYSTAAHILARDEDNDTDSDATTTDQ